MTASNTAPTGHDPEITNINNDERHEKRSWQRSAEKSGSGGCINAYLLVRCGHSTTVVSVRHRPVRTCATATPAQYAADREPDQPGQHAGAEPGDGHQHRPAVPDAGEREQCDGQ